MLAVALASASGCGRGPSVVASAVTPLGALPRSPRIIGRDGGASRIAFGRSIWAFGDTVLAEADASGESWHTNSWDYMAPLPGALGPFSFRADRVGAPAYFVELTADEVAFNKRHHGDGCAEPPCNVRFALWPGPPIWDPVRQRAWIFFGLFNDAAPSGIGIARWERFEEAPKRQPALLLNQAASRHPVDASTRW